MTISETALRQSVLIGEEAIIGVEADLMSALHGLSQQECSKTPGQSRRGLLLEKDPNVATLSRAGNFEIGRHSVFRACSQERNRVFLPGRLIEVRSQEPTGLILKERVDPNGDLSLEMGTHYLIRER